MSRLNHLRACVISHEFRVRFRILKIKVFKVKRGQKR